MTRWRRIAASYRRVLYTVCAVALVAVLWAYRGTPLHAPSTALAGQARLAGARLEPSDTIELSGLQEKFESVATSVARSVVAISASVDRMDSDDVLRSAQMNGQKLASLLEKTTRIVGTGFVIDPDGYVVTNEHVVGESEQLWLTTDQREVYPAIVIGSDPRSDLAVLKIPATGMLAVKYAPAGSVRRGQWTIALGNPYGLAVDGEMCMSVGVVSATDRSLPRLANKENRLYSNLIQTTAEINPGNSGGPLFDLSGNVIGINTAVILPQKATNGIGFAIPVTPQLLHVLDQLKRGQEITYGYLGVRVVTPTEYDRQQTNTAANVGARIELVEPTSSARDLLQEGDVVVEVNGQQVRDGEHFVRLIGDAPIGQPAHFIIHRGPRTIEGAAPIVRREMPGVAITRLNRRLRWRGLLLGPIPEHWSFPGGKRPESGVMVLAVAKSSGLAGQVSEGSVITALAGKPVNDIVAAQRIINDTPASQCTIQVFGSRPAVVSAGD